MKRNWEKCKTCFFFDVVSVEIGLPVLTCLKDENIWNWVRVDRKAQWYDLDEPKPNCYLPILKESSEGIKKETR